MPSSCDSDRLGGKRRYSGEPAERKTVPYHQRERPVSWFKKKADYPTRCEWVVFNGTKDGMPLIVRKNLSAAILRRGGEYPARVGVALRLLEASPDGLPSPTELTTLNNLEDSLAAAMESNQSAIHVLTITTSGFREQVFYAKESSDLGSALSDLRERFPDYDIQAYAEKDTGWIVYEEFGA
jgi:hypothetical protein